jgi:hypothetical protein
MSNSTEERSGQDDYVVVVTTYPTTYGANDGMEWTPLELLQNSDSDVYGPDAKNMGPDEPGSSFKEYKDAVAFALKMVEETCVFDDHGYTKDDKPPYDPADLENYDNDEEVLIEVMTKTEFAVMMQFNLQKLGLIDSQGDAIKRP